ncbi:MAG TPA: hypothetical protein VGM73_04625 [Candidatus Didemnitutus sp.]
MNDLIHSLFISHPPAPATGATDPLWPVRRSFGEDDATAPVAKAPSRRPRPTLRRKRVPLAA